MIVIIIHLPHCFLTSFFVTIAVRCVKLSARYLKDNVLGSKSVGLPLRPCQQDSLSGSLNRYISISIAWQCVLTELTKFYTKRMFEGQLKITLRLPVRHEFVSECPFPTVQMPFPHSCFLHRSWHTEGLGWTAFIERKTTEKSLSLPFSCST